MGMCGSEFRCGVAWSVFHSREVFKVLVVRDNVNWSQRPFKVVSPTLECFEDGQEFFIMDVVIHGCRNSTLWS